MFALLVVITYPVNALDRTANADQLVFGRRAGSDADAQRLLSLYGCVHAVVYVIDNVESRILWG
jgi:hypothetical protein